MAGRSPKRRRWWRSRSPFAHVRKARRYLEAHERALILADLKAIGGQGSWEDFERHVPGRYDKRYFDSVMTRLAPYDVKYRGRSRFFVGMKVWSLPDVEIRHGDEDQRIYNDLRKD